MTVATSIISLALKAAGVLGVGQTALAQDSADGFTMLNEMVDNWNVERGVLVIATPLPRFPDSITDVEFWYPYEASLLWGLACRLRVSYGLPPDDQMLKLAQSSAALLQANNRQQLPAQPVASTDTTANGLVFLALRAAGRVTDQQNVLSGSQDATDGLFMLVEMLSEWQQDRTVSVTPGYLPVIIDPAAAITITLGLQSAIVWNLAVRMRSAFGLEDNKFQMERADRSLAAIQANNKQQQPSLYPGAVDTVLQLIMMALRTAGRINDTQSVALGSQDVNDAFAALVAMLAQWQRRRWLIPSLTELVTASTGSESYGIGPTSTGRIGFTDEFTDDFEKNVALSSFGPLRPDRIESAFVRLVGRGLQVDYSLDIIESQEDYNEIGIKGLVSFPSSVFYQSAFPLGFLYFWPIPAAGLFELHVFVKSPLQQFVTVNDPLLVPAEYIEAMHFNLAMRICTITGVPARADIAALARASLETIRNANAQVAELGMPGGLPGIGNLGGVAAPWLGGAVYPAGVTN